MEALIYELHTLFTRAGENWRLIMALVWCGCMALDYLSGTAAAAKNGSWSSTQARQGLWHKGGMILVVAVAAIADAVLAAFARNLPAGVFSTAGTSGLTWPGLLLPLVLGWYIVTELGSVLENAILLGAAVPAWLKGLLQLTLDRIDTLGAQAVVENSAGKTQDVVENSACEDKISTFSTEFSTISAAADENAPSADHPQEADTKEEPNHV